MKALVGALSQEKALVGAFSVIVIANGSFAALVMGCADYLQFLVIPYGHDQSSSGYKSFRVQKKNGGEWER